ncbi:unnamed protein product [Owenia fusiformis]|uniref:Uncharacterized protein n=1 Tax=Owenia fusiformis TaxID=6347 RepID=A0A8J1TVZ1_OWEFU|nr:unnamed protein product [Owenia fusiformis]
MARFGQTGLVVLGIIVLSVPLLCQDLVEEEEPDWKPINLCNSDNCKLPYCNCAGTKIPGKLSRKETPQMVMFTFDDAVNAQVWGHFKKLFHPSRKNPNGCPISITLFVSHNYTDYCMVNRMWALGHEIASHSITHRVPTDWWSNAEYEDWEFEIWGQKNNLMRDAKVPIKEIQGMRSPFLAVGGDNQFSMLEKFNFSYDATIVGGPANLEDPTLWPYTLDFSMEEQDQNCNIPPCPHKRYPGFWEIPVLRTMDVGGIECSFVDKCLNRPGDAEEMYEFLWMNFLRNYETNRAPFGLNMHAIWFSSYKYTVDGFDMFIKKLLQLDDVYIVTSSDAIKWIQDPTPLSRIRNFKPWLRSCKRQTPDDCKLPKEVGDYDWGGGWGDLSTLWIWEYIIMFISAVVLIKRDNFDDV